MSNHGAGSAPSAQTSAPRPVRSLRYHHENLVAQDDADPSATPEPPEHPTTSAANTRSAAPGPLQTATVSATPHNPHIGPATAVMDHFGQAYKHDTARSAPSSEYPSTSRPIQYGAS